MASNPNAMRTLTKNAIFTNCAITPDGDVWWEQMTDEQPPGLIDWLRRPWAPGSPRKAAHPNARFTVAARQCPVIAAGVGGPGRRADRRDPLRRTTIEHRAARDRGVRLAARHVPRRDGEQRDDGRGGRQSRPAPPRSDGHAPVLRLQHGRLLGSLAELHRAHRGGLPAADLLRQLVPPGRGREVPLARLRREQPRAQVDLRAALRAGPRPSTRRSAACRSRAPSTSPGSPSPTSGCASCCPSTSTAGGPRSH